MNFAFIFYIALIRLFYKILQTIATKYHASKKRKLGARGVGSKIAHRGSRIEGIPENTVAAFKDAIKAGAQIIELDVWITPDGKIVVHHDETLLRMSGGLVHDNIWQTRYKDLPDIQPEEGQSERIGGYSKEEYSKIPLFDTVLKTIPKNICIIVEFKSDSEHLISEVKRILEDNDRKDSVYWFSLDEKTNAKLRVADPTIPTISSVVGMLKIIFYYYIGILPFVTLDDAAFSITVEEVPLDRIRREKALKGFPDWFKRILAFIFQGKPPHVMLASGLFSQLRQRGVPVWFLGVNSESDLLLAVKLGATGVLTDRINWLSRTMKEKNLAFRKIVV